MMKRLFLISAVAIAAATAASCQKEFIGNDNNTNTPESSQLRTFTATIAATDTDTKAAIADDGRFTFTEGDFIYIFNGSGVINADGSKGIQFRIGNFDYTSKTVLSDGSSWGTGAVVAESIRITAEMISNGGKTLTFSTSVAEPADGGKWYFILADGGASWDYFTIRPDSDAWTRFFVNQDKIVCYAGIDKASFNSSIALKHYDSRFRFKVSNISDYDKVTITPNSGAVSTDNCISAIYEAKRGQNKYEVTTAKEVSVALSADDASKVYYVGVVPNRTWAGGITFHLWKDGVEIKTLKISKDITIGVGDIIDFGDLAKVRPDYTSLYEKYQAGYDINVGGVVVNKSTYGDATLLTNGTELVGGLKYDTYNKGVFFVEKGATVTCTTPPARLFCNGDVFIIGDANDGTRSTLNLSTTSGSLYVPDGAYGIAFKNMEINNTISQPLFTAGSGSKISWFIFENSKLTGAVNAMVLENNCSRPIGKLIFKDSEFRISKNNTYFLQSTACTVDEYVVDNCIFYPETDGSLLSNPVIFACLASSVTVKNSTFINLHNTQLFGSNGTAYPANFAPTIGNNLRYYTVAPASGTSAIFHLGWTGVDPANLTAGGVYIQGGNTNGTAFKPAYSADSVVDIILDSDPFSSLDFANGVFVNTTTYGAKR